MCRYWRVVACHHPMTLLFLDGSTLASQLYTTDTCDVRVFTALLTQLDDMKQRRVDSSPQPLHPGRDSFKILIRSDASESLSPTRHDVTSFSPNSSTHLFAMFFNEPIMWQLYVFTQLNVQLH